MSIFESISNTSDKASDIGETYLKKSQEYYRLKIFQQLTVSVSMIGKALIIGGLLFIGLIFIAVASAIALGEWIHNMAIGYLIVAVIFMIFATIVYVKRQFINKKIITVMAPKFFDI